MLLIDPRSVTLHKYLEYDLLSITEALKIFSSGCLH